MVPGEELDAAQEKLEKNSVFIHELVAKVSDLEQFHELADRLIPKPAPAPKKKPENRPHDTDRSKAQAAAPKES